MNPVEQRTHKTAVEQLRSDVEVIISTFVTDMAEEFADQRAATTKASFALSDKVRIEIASVRDEQRTFQGRDFRGRCRWLFLGR